MSLPPLTPEQRAAALAKAAAARKERQRLKDLLSAATLAEIFQAAEADPVVGKMRVSALLEAVLGHGAAARLMERLDISPTCRIQGLGARRRAALESEYVKAVTAELRESRSRAGAAAMRVIRLSLHVAPDGHQIADVPGEFRLDVSAHDELDVERALRDAGAALLPDRRHLLPQGITGSDYATIALAASPGAWLCIRAAIQAIGARHRHKTFQFDLPDGGTLRIDGYSETSLTRILEAAGAAYEARLEQAGGQRERRQALIDRAARTLLAHRDDLAADQVTGWCLDRVARALGDRTGDPDTLLHRVRLAVDALREREQSALPAITAEQARLALAEAAELLALADEHRATG